MDDIFPLFVLFHLDQRSTPIDCPFVELQQHPQTIFPAVCFTLCMKMVFWNAKLSGALGAQTDWQVHQHDGIFIHTHTHTHTHTTILLIIALNTLMLPVCDCVSVFSRRRLLPLSLCRLQNRKRQDVVVVAAVVVVVEQHWPTFWVMCHRHKLLLRF